MGQSGRLLSSTSSREKEVTKEEEEDGLSHRVLNKFVSRSEVYLFGKLKTSTSHFGKNEKIYGAHFF